MSTYPSYTKSTTKIHSSMHNGTHRSRSAQSNGTPSSLDPSKKTSADGWIPIDRSWGQARTKPTLPTATQQLDKDKSPMSSWLSEPQQEQPWNAIGSVRAPSFGAGTASNATMERGDQKQDSERANRGSTASRR